MADIIVIASGKGGVGKSSLTCGVGKVLANRGHKTLVADFDIGLRSLDIMLDASENVIFDWGDLLLDRCSLEQAVIVCDKLHFLAAPQSFSDEITPSLVSEMFDALTAEYEYIIIDAPAGIAEGFSLACAAAQKAILVTTPDNVCVRSCSYAARVLRAIGINDIRLVVNRFSVRPACKRKLLNIDECIDASTVQLLGVVPEDRQVVYSSVLNSAPGEYSPASCAYERIAARITGARIPLVVE